MVTPAEPRIEDTFQLTFNKIMALKPLDSIQRLFETLLPVAEKIVARRQRNASKKEPGIYLLTEGQFWLYRKQDDLELCMAQAPHIFGLAELVLPFSEMPWIRFSADSEVFVVPSHKAKALCNNQPTLWEDISKVIAFHLHFSTWRDLHLLNDSAYDTIRGKLFELEKQSEEFRQRNSVLSYILATTKLSRSTVMRIMKDLDGGGYLEIKRGKLSRIVHLPLRY
ncbi:putative DNA-binding transcriptional regulator [Serratia quinivorans]|jgi:CRP-like cAMP-binding protein|uniref:Helix-turn-helix domain-containing protein n=1 Tax=Serratia quinivorans TaxID=137545 RepID=A0ABV3UIU0_9GAMM|nr:helix-turn-helix domain-containing protein [Serratia quinivorans]CAI1568192.1 putative DNA-binding transcriptional regulator [Serratia quinivorans]CAI1695341.1 putative DNA-binding transcriptional regulator [Serratia quinivorans]CAI1725480.1 putative DNA-binding transcriptional regulator [Serratia quinivorans]